MKKFLTRFIRPVVGPEVHEQFRIFGTRIERLQIMNYAFEFAAKSGLDGYYMEFGTYSGMSFTAAYKAYEKMLQARFPGQRMQRRKMYAFDSFRGLPELKDEDKVDGYEVFEGGQYAKSEQDFLSALRRGGVDTERVVTIPGFFEDSLTDERKASFQDGKAMVVHIDCDLQSSAITVLDWLTDLVQDGTVILFDDYFCYRGHPARGVRGAFRQWLKKTGLSATPYLNYSWAGKVFIINTDAETGETQI